MTTMPLGHIDALGEYLINLISIVRVAYVDFQIIARNFYLS